MPIVQLDNIHKSYGTDLLFDSLELKIYRKEKIGLIGHNGSGKTTLFRLILGQETPDAGEVKVRRDYSIGYLPQEPSFTPCKSVIELMHENISHLFELQDELSKAGERLGSLTGIALDKAMREYEELSVHFELAGGYDYETRIRMILDGVGLGPELYDNTPDQLSGGQLSRLALATVLMKGSDLLLLDEPTNHLDLVAAEWLENYIRNYAGAVVIISHDRFLLDKVAVKIVELENFKANVWKGNYSRFLESKEQERVHSEREYEKRSKMLAHETDFIARNRNDVGMKRVARGRAKRLERLLENNPDFLARQQKRRVLSFSFDEIRNESYNVLKCSALSKSYGDLTLFSQLDFEMMLGERLAITGPNGTGKSTLLKIALGLVKPDTGKLKFGQNLVIGYLDQQGEELRAEDTVLDEVLKIRPDISPGQARNVLGAFLFFADDVFKRVENLSGGERNRLMLCRLMMQRPDVLVLDEPTNHLDIASKEALENAILEYDGTVILVSHDRYFIDKIAERMLVMGVNKLGKKELGSFEMRGPGVKLYSEYSEEITARNNAAIEAKYASTVSQTPQRKNKRHKERVTAPEEIKPFNKYRIEQIEELVMETEQLIEDKKDCFGLEEYYKDHEKMQRLEAEIAEKKAYLELLYLAYEWKMR
ncbi:MAG: ribosomal protection-like ABC-F family protein [Phycisphaerae bacterium]|jgi:ATP-binding cassette subfamily F protein 3